MNPRERRWRRRNPDLAVKFDRLPKAAQANIRTAFLAPTARGVSEIVRQADMYRREHRRAVARGEGQPRAIKRKPGRMPTRQYTVEFEGTFSDSTKIHMSHTWSTLPTKNALLDYAEGWFADQAFRQAMNPGSDVFIPPNATLERVRITRVLKPNR